MTNLDIWEVDRIAAADLLASLREATDDDLMRVAAAAFSKHREQSHEWAARRVHQSAIQTLETTASREFDRRDTIWTDGFRFAEQCLWACNAVTLLGTFSRPTATKGQILRSMIRSARKRRAA